MRQHLRGVGPGRRGQALGGGGGGVRVSWGGGGMRVGVFSLWWRVFFGKEMERAGLVLFFLFGGGGFSKWRPKWVVALKKPTTSGPRPSEMIGMLFGFPPPF